ncbi:hypothetical protein EV360DRAFT_75953 [Lentinula raphanica]|nr:hypothetical protein EV360DRAFT_75953 [Lentinula raphanica]
MNRFALVRVVLVVGAVSTVSLAAPTLLPMPPSEASGALEALSGHEEPSVTLLPLQVDPIPSQGVDAREPLAIADVVVDPVTGTDDLSYTDNTWSSGDVDARAHDHIQDAVADVPYEHVNLKLVRRIDEEQMAVDNAHKLFTDYSQEYGYLQQKLKEAKENPGLLDATTKASYQSRLNDLNKWIPKYSKFISTSKYEPTATNSNPSGDGFSAVSRGFQGSAQLYAQASATVYQGLPYGKAQRRVIDRYQRPHSNDATAQPDIPTLSPQVVLVKDKRRLRIYANSPPELVSLIFCATFSYSSSTALLSSFRRLYPHSPTMKRLQALRVVYVVGAVSTTLAAPTSLQPPSEALSGLEEPSTAPLYQFQAEGFPATAGLDVHVPQVTTILSDESVRTDPDDLFDKLKTWNIRDDHDHTAITLADISYNPVDSKLDTAGIDVPEPQATTTVVDSVRTQDPDDFFDETRSFRDDADAHDSGGLIQDICLLFSIQHDQSAVTDALYNHVGSKLRRRANSGTQSTSGSQPSSSQELVDICYAKYSENKKAAENLYAELALIQPSKWGSKQTKLVAQVNTYVEIAISWLTDAHKRGTQARVKGQSGYKSIPLPNLAKETERLKDLISKAQSLPITGATSEAPTSPPVSNAGGPAKNRGGYKRKNLVGSDNGDAESESDDYVPSKPRGYKRKKPVDDGVRDSDPDWLPYKSGTSARTTSRKKAGRPRKGNQVDPDGDYVPPAGFSSRVGASQTGSSRGGPSTKSSTLAQKAADSDSDYVPGSDYSV